MSTAARKARKRNGIKFEKAPKVGTPVEERSYLTQPVIGAYSTRFAGTSRGRSDKKREQFLKHRIVTS